MRRVVQFVKDAVAGKPKSLRSSGWDEVRDAHVKKFPSCAACGRGDHPQVHHIKPFHLFRSLELEPANLITLCEQSDTKCHLHIGHHGNWKNFNEQVVQDAAEALAVSRKTSRSAE